MPLSYQTWLQARTPQQLAALLRLRPDTALPVPPTVASLATRLRIRSSVARVLRRLTAAELSAAEAAADLGAEFQPVERGRILARLEPHLGADRAAAALQRLAEAGLLYGDGEVMLLKEVLGSLSPDWRLLGDTDLTEEEIGHRLDRLDPTRRAMLDTLASSAGMGLTREENLVEAGLVIRVDERTVRLPLAVRRVLRGASPAHIPLTPPTGRPLEDTRGVDEAGVSAGLDAVRLIAQVIAALGERPLVLLRAGGIGIRETRRLARDLHIEVPLAKRLLCLAQATGLLDAGEPDRLPEEDHSYLAPTPQADTWLAAEPAQRLTLLVTGWRSSRWAYWAEEKILDEEDPRLPTLRGIMLAPYLAAPTAPAAFSEVEAASAALFHAPVIASGIGPETWAHLREEAEWLGVLAGGSATSAFATATAAAAENANTAATALIRPEANLADLVPATVHQVIVQADMTALAPGPLEYRVEAELSLMADLESPGLASVYRFSEASVRRAFDAGRSARDLLDFLNRLSLGPLPQALTYLVEEMGTRHGALRGGTALCYVRCEDPTTLAAAVHASASLRALAPTVAISEVPLGNVIAELQAAGFRPAAEDASGISIDLRPEPARITASGSRRRPRAAAPELTEEKIAGVVDKLLAAEGAPQAPEEEDHVAVLGAAARGARTVTVEYVDAHGDAVRRALRPLRITAGHIDAMDPATGTAHRIGLHRVTSVELVP
ncbi:MULTISPECIES: helicase-associated domain-containing protein [unclassified Corynebacterium]|uniref:helicase-associated domain-containing protein n=1 Tax=unclassified Corynebacterium TaxID=2624378 RepID=UPI0029CA8F24|nr:MULTISPECIES: helicase-associated domain-containing protein [unclassified Corynebacterium]WPF66730.1 helicase-associated domain-containing protein [Corynebacterium sp. 22KM0430]WPF69218.1 helicase-associated domain-containing protein [Corynebacterium sp. 21KM1197]